MGGVDLGEFEISCMQAQSWKQSKQRHTGDLGYL
jgi:hypothetical protein